MWSKLKQLWGANKGKILSLGLSVLYNAIKAKFTKKA